MTKLTHQVFKQYIVYSVGFYLIVDAMISMSEGLWGQPAVYCWRFMLVLAAIVFRADVYRDKQLNQKIMTPLLTQAYQTGALLFDIGLGMILVEIIVIHTCDISPNIFIMSWFGQVTGYFLLWKRAVLEECGTWHLYKEAMRLSLVRFVPYFIIFIGVLSFYSRPFDLWLTSVIALAVHVYFMKTARRIYRPNESLFCTVPYCSFITGSAAALGIIYWLVYKAGWRSPAATVILGAFWLATLALHVHLLRAMKSFVPQT